MNAIRPRFNPWPYGIIATLGVFIVGLAALVTASLGGRTELIAPDYYDQEIRFQSTIDARRRAMPFDAEIRVAYDTESKSVALALPRSHASAGVEGTVEFYRPSGAAQDQKIALQLDSNGTQTIAASGLAAGPWDLRLSWRSGAEEFSVTRRIVIRASAL